MKVNDDTLLRKYKQIGLSNEEIGKRLGWPSSQVEERWRALQQQKATACGYEELSAQFYILCHQYQLLGESLKILAGALSNLPSIPEIQACIKQDPGDTLKALTSSFIILRAFQPVNPAEALARHLAPDNPQN